MAASFLFDFPSVLHVNRYHLKECFSVREQSKGHGILLSDARSFPLKPSRASFKKKTCTYRVCEQTTGMHALLTQRTACFWDSRLRLALADSYHSAGWVLRAELRKRDRGVSSEARSASLTSERCCSCRLVGSPHGEEPLAPCPPDSRSPAPLPIITQPRSG